MLYGDEEVISKRIQALNEKQHTIHNAVRVGGATYTFAQRLVTPEFAMVLPEAFEEMPPQLARIKYPSEDRPQVILTSGDMLVNICFTLHKRTYEYAKDRRDRYRAIVKRLYPANRFYTGEGVGRDDKKTVECFSYRSSAIDMNLFNLAFFTDLEDHDLMGWFNCPADVRAAWEPLVLEMLKTIVPIMDDDKDTEKGG